jgi:ABC-type Fe3+/spermidine/putrescine transport system ATPase subunit
MTEEGLVLSGLVKRFGDHVAVRDVSLTVPHGRVLALLGPSGSGKTTTLRLIAGFERPDAGHVTVNGKDVTGLGPAQRRFGMVFQNYALFPHLDVAQNVAFGLDRSLSREDRSRRVAEALALVDLAGFESRRVTELSGGQQQRVAVARAVAPAPAVLLFDEPLSNLDPALRERTRRELRAALDQVGVTTVFVTHEQEEAFLLGDLVAVLRDGALEQLATPPELYEAPRTRFVAGFVGRASELPGTWLADGRVRIGDSVTWPSSTLDDTLQPGDDVIVAVRPEAMTVADQGGLPGIVRDRRYTGARAFFDVETAHGSVEVEASVHAIAIGDHVTLDARTSRAFRGADA